MLKNASKWLVVIALCLPGTAAANVERRLAEYEQEAATIATNLPRPNQLTGSPERKLVDAQIAFSLGDYDTAALMLYDLASKPGPERDVATYYLGETLFQKGERGAARTHFAQIVASNNTAGKYYQPSLLRLIEIAIATTDMTDVDANLAALDRLGTTQTSAAPYVRGKLLYAQGKYDEALSQFALVPPGSEHELQAHYFSATTHVAKKDVARATQLFTELGNRKPRSAKDRRVIELSQMALGRLYYEQAELAKSIDAYLLIDRRSDLFADALYEVAWVYVKNKQYDKALRALELLNLSEPVTQKTPTLRILEGNLRMRKAQMIRQAQLAGTVGANPESPAVEYAKAAAVFEETRRLYLPSYQMLSQLVDQQGDPAEYLAQLAGRSTKIFQSSTLLPEAAAQYLREEPTVQRAVAVERDLGEIESNIRISEATITRLEAVLASNDRTAVYPALASRRSRIGQIQDDLIKIRSELADKLGSSDANRRSLVAQYAAMPSPEAAQTDATARAHQALDGVGDGLSEVRSALDSSQAMAVAIRKYSDDMTAAATPLPADMKTNVDTTLSQAQQEAAAIEAELAAVERELTLARDLAGVGHEPAAQARELRRQVRAAQDAEAQRLAGRGSKDSTLLERATRLSQQLAQAESQIDALVDRGMQEAKQVIAQERATIGTLKEELAKLETESRSLGGTVLGASFKTVKEKFYDIVIRTDVGTVDVSWSQKEDADDDLKRLNLSRQREIKQLRDEFKGVMDGGTPTKSAPSAPTPPQPTPDAPPAGSPDKGTQERVKPGADQPATTPTPVVRPDNETQPKGTTPPKGGSR